MSLYGTSSPFFNRGAGTTYSESAFADPFNDYATTQMPTTMRSALWWSEYIWQVQGTYRMAMERIVSYFLTDIELGGEASDDEKKKYKEFLDEQLYALNFLGQVMRDRLCFHGDVKTTTRDGVFKLRELVGQTVDVLSRDGVYRPATFKSFGRQELLQVEFSDGRTVLATPEHEWIALNCSGKEVTVATKDLKPRYRIQRTVAPRPAKDADYHEGVRHGFTFGDGYLHQRSPSRPGGSERPLVSCACFYGDKDSQLLPYFEGHGYKPLSQPEQNRVVIDGLPAHYKQLPANDASASYWYGFVSGFLAADGTVDQHGCALLTQITRTTLEAIEAQLPRIGMAAGPIRAQRRITDLRKYNGENRTNSGIYDTTIHFMTLLKQFMTPDDFLLEHHRANFCAEWNPESSYGRYVAVRGVTETGLVDEVFCCQEMETHTFVIDQGVLTKNCYGNAFASVVVPFRRYLQCPKTGDMYPLKVVYYNFDFKFNDQFEFVATCPKTGWRGPWQLIDKPREESDHLILKRWNPHEIELLHDPYTDEVAYLWRIPEYYKRMVKEGNLFHLERASKQVLEAIRHNKLFRFNKEALFHMKEPTLAGIRNMGWGIPRSIVNYRQIWYVQVLRRYNEAIALDYIVPFRLITPGTSGGTSAGGIATNDPMSIYAAGDFRSQVRGMLNRRRRDPASWQMLPFPVNYQMLGGDAKQLAPTEMIQQGYETLLNESGAPVEFYNGSLAIQAAPVALRLFESTHRQLVTDANMLLQWMVNAISRIMSWELIDCNLKRVTIADDMQKQMSALQLMMGQQLSGTSGLAAIGYDWETEQKRIADEARKQQEMQARQQEEMEQAGFAQQIAKGVNPMAPPAGGDPNAAAGGAGGAPAGGAPAGGDPAAAGMPSQSPVSNYIQSMGPNAMVTPNDLQSAAEQLANELLGLPEGVKDSELRKLKQFNPTLHSITRAKMDEIRSQMRTQGGAMLQQQQFGGG